MNEDDEVSSQIEEYSQRDREAAYWLVEVSEGLLNMEPKQRALFDTWMSDPDNWKAFSKLKEISDSIDRLIGGGIH